MAPAAPPSPSSTSPASETSPPGGNHSLACLSGGTRRAWGGNNAGQLGNGSTTNSGTPATVRTGIGTITRIAAGGEWSLAA
ncbi:hypothetical protein [Streptomyces sp. NPDC059874]|uniref:hypothetical protein n=1 Tax=Streptomyces sp. NPDC059874 TaxID=3346983 RepID=UPI0036489A12